MAVGPLNQLGQPARYQPAAPAKTFASLFGSAFAGLGPAGAATVASAQPTGRPAAPRSSVSAPAAKTPVTAGAPPPVAPEAPHTAAAGIDYSADPILAQIRLLGQQAVPDALANADAARKQLLIAFGDPNLARNTVFGGKGFDLPGIAGGPGYHVADTTHVGDEGSAVAAGQNPFSTLARLLNTHKQNDTTIDETRNGQNLFYSGARANDLTGEQHGYEQNQADGYSALAQALAQIDAQVQAAYQSEAARQMQAEQDAWTRAVAGAAVNPPAPPGPNSSPVAPSAGRLIEDLPGAITKVAGLGTIAQPVKRKPSALNLLFK